MAKAKKKHPILQVFLYLFISIIILVLVAGLFVLKYVLALSETLPEFDETSFQAQQTSFIYDADGNAYTSIYVTENRVNVTSDDLPDFMFDVLVATEDMRFYDHFGVDIKRIFGAIVSNIKTGSMGQGASTITMQVARTAILKSQEKEMDRKIQEALLAIKIERDYSKEEILCFYLNQVFWGHGCHGIQAASQYYFNKDAIELTLGEAAMLVGILPSPSNYSPYVNMERAESRKTIALNNLERYDTKYAYDIEQARKEPITLSRGTTSTAQQINYNYPWFTDYIISEAESILSDLGYEASDLYTGGFKVHSTITPSLQLKMEKVYSDPNFFPESSTGDLIESAMVILDPKTGAVKAMVGGREYVTRRGFNRATALQRQPGSTIKPLVVYGPAIEAGYSPGSPINDSQTNFGTEEKPYVPVNQNGRYQGIMTMRTALRNSINVPAVKFLSMIGIDAGLKFGQNLGLSLGNNDAYLPLALGGISAGFSPLEMGTAYSAYANMGIFNDNYCIDAIYDSKDNLIYRHQAVQQVVMDEVTAYLVNDMLQSVVQAGTGTAARLDRPVAGKTGTTELPDKPEFKGKRGNKDAWWVGYTPDLLGVVWMGYDKERDAENNLQYLNQIYGGRYPAELWKEVMSFALSGIPASDFPDPGGWKYVEIDTKTGLLPSELTPSTYITREKFKEDNVPRTASDIWQTVTVCAETGMLASNFCTNIEHKVLMKRNPADPPKTNSGDYALYVPVWTCNIHNAPDSTAQTVYICTDPRHEGIIHLANLPQDSEEGGCPAEYVQAQTFSAALLPTTNCPLEDHQTRVISVSDIPSIPSDLPSAPDSIPSDTTPTENPEDPLLAAPTLSGMIRTGDNGTLNYLAWVDSVNNPINTMYVIEKIINNDPLSTTTIETYGTSYSDADILAGNSYQYRVYAFVRAEEKISYWSNTISLEP